MFRYLLLIIAVVIIIWIVRGFISRSQLNKPNSVRSKDMVQCEQCKTYIPKDDAINSNGKLFCSQQHLNDWNKQA
ncbi:MAG TPA: PP0621 family protein [Gammaproteobacteria bacterium]